MKVVVGVDLGGTRIKLVGMTTEGTVRDRSHVETNDRSLKTPEKIDYWVETIREHVQRIEDRISTRVEAVGLAAPGLANAERATVVAMPGRLEGLERLDWSKALSLRRPLAVLNDAHAALLGESWIGAAVGVRDVVLLTLGTGVGGAAMLDGRIVRGTAGRAAHFGHMTLDLDGDPDICGTPGSLELFVGEETLGERSGGRFRTNEELRQAYESGDEGARNIWFRTMRALACGISSIVNLFDPSLVLLAGGVTEGWQAIARPLAQYMEELEWRPLGKGVEIRKAELGSFAGAIGAARAAAERAGLFNT